ncbi:hypothetical protein FHS23_003919 [Prauserella isguenensis]|uniref:DUF4237 domain-containing protein n=1 Tax=Prauserella isguenensis TaxID=1470180 RepID=A0A839S585_9PSEU|nr:glycohydrolase toxin TNT-related protein [Prauserella isguenensis]MBB3052878.1 hypothetical protein [Prauserella isguenensis]
MGIELPAELADIAAEAGVSWPQADEDAMREQARSWRQAAGQLQGLARDADTVAGQALGSMSGEAVDAARQTWSGFIDPERGSLTRAAQGAGDAADRLDRAAEQIGRTKVELVRKLRDAAVQRDAAGTAADAGHPAALAGVDTVIQGTAANMRAITGGLADTVGVDGAGPGVAPDVVTDRPGNAGALAGSGGGGGGGLLGALGLPDVAETTAATGESVLDEPGGGNTGLGSGGPGGGGLGDSVFEDASGLFGSGRDEGDPPGGQGSPSGAGTSGPQAPLGPAEDVLGQGSGIGSGGALGDASDVLGDGAAPGGPGGVLGGGGGGAGTAEPGRDLLDGVEELLGGPDGPGHGGPGGPGASDGPGLPGGPGFPGEAGGEDTPPFGLGRPPLPGGDALPGGEPVSSGQPVPPFGGGAGGTGPIVLPDAPTPPGGIPVGSPWGQPASGGDAPTPPTGTSLSGFSGPPAPGALPPQAGAVPPAAGGQPGGFGPQPAGPPVGGPVAGGGAVPGGPVAGGGAAPGGPVPPAAGPVGGAAQPGQYGQQNPYGRPPAGQQYPGQQYSGQQNPGQQNPGQGQHPYGRPPAGQQYPPQPPAGQPPQARNAPPAPGAGPYAPAPGGAHQHAAPPPPASQAQAPQPQAPALGSPRQERESVVALFLVHMFPIGHLPVASDRPARQLPVPEPEHGAPVVARFEPHDHPNSDLIEPDQAIDLLRQGARQPAPPPSAVLPCPPTAVRDGYDPLGGMHERDWDARFLATDGGAAAEDGTAEDVTVVEADGRDARATDSTATDSTDTDRNGTDDPVADDSVSAAEAPAAAVESLGSVPLGSSAAGEVPEYVWPPADELPEGCSADGEPEVLPAGTMVDRFGTAHGRVFSADGTPFEQRSLPPSQLDAGYRRYRVLRDVPMWRGVSAGWFGQPGGGARYRAVYSAAELVSLGYLADATFEPVAPRSVASATSDSPDYPDASDNRADTSSEAAVVSAVLDGPGESDGDEKAPVDTGTERNPKESAP